MGLPLCSNEASAFALAFVVLSKIPSLSFAKSRPRFDKLRTNGVFRGSPSRCSDKTAFGLSLSKPVIECGTSNRGI